MMPAGLGRLLLVVTPLAGLSACGAPEPRAIRYGQDVCAYCRMTITDPRFAAYLVTTKGRTYVFDDIGGLAAFVIEGRLPASAVHSIWVNRFLEPESLLDASAARYVRSEVLTSPMGTGVAAAPTAAEAETLRAQLGADPGAAVLRWTDIVAAADSLTERRRGAVGRETPP